MAMATKSDEHISLTEEDSMGAAKPLVKGFFDERTFSIQYVVADIRTKKCAIVDPVLDLDEKSGATATKNADAILAYIEEQGSVTVEATLK